MPTVFDNINIKFLPKLQETLQVSKKADFCVGYFNLRGWKHLCSQIDAWTGDTGNCCRLLVGMQNSPDDTLFAEYSLKKEQEEVIDNHTAIQIKKKLAEDFRTQLVVGTPTNDDEKALRKLAQQIKQKKVVVKLFLKHPLHAKLYLCFREDPISPIVGYLGSSNLTFAGLIKQGELNIDVLDQDACQKLSKWFDDRWNDRLCLDISAELVKVIEESWAREELIPPYFIYIKMAYHLCQEARAGISEFSIPRDFGQKLFEFQTAAVKIAAHHVNKRGGVLFGDVVGLGKTLMATALAKVLEDDFGWETLIICPKNLVKMWEEYRQEYRLYAKVVSISQAERELKDLRRYRLVLIDESHNLRNREGKRYRSIQEYIKENESKVILLSATPYNKNYLDLSNQLRLFLPEDRNLGVRPEYYLEKTGEIEFSRRHQCQPNTLAAFEKSEFPDDWRELMRLFMVRRTRSFIQENYAQVDEQTGQKYLLFSDGTRSYFPVRQPRSMKFKTSNDQFAKLFSDTVVGAINNLSLPRYGLGNYVAASPNKPPTNEESKILKNLSRAGRRLKGFCRTNLFKRLESSGEAFVLSMKRHILRNFVYLHAIENDLPLPIGTQTADILDPESDSDYENLLGRQYIENDDADEENNEEQTVGSSEELKKRSKVVYQRYRDSHSNLFQWLRPSLFTNDLRRDIEADSQALVKILDDCGEWNPEKDTKLKCLINLVNQKHPDEKILVFTQFADTVNYLSDELKKKGIEKVAGVSGDSSDPTELAWRFSPESNHKQNRITKDEELRVLVATDILSEGQNLQDCNIVVNYDLPWAVIRLIQRAGRIDRIGQKSHQILCYSFLPAEGVEKIIKLRQRIRKRLNENAEVIGTDEAFFDDEKDRKKILDLYNEKAGILDDDPDNEVDLASYAYQIWKNAINLDPALQKTIPALPDVVFSSKPHFPQKACPEGVLVYLRTAEGTDSLAWVNKDGNRVTESQFTILKGAECRLEAPAIPKADCHHRLVEKGVKEMLHDEKSVGGQLGRPSGARFRVYERLKRYIGQYKGTLFDRPEVHKTMEDIYQNPLRPGAVDILNRQLKTGIEDEQLVDLVVGLRESDGLTISNEEAKEGKPRLICSMGLFCKGDPVGRPQKGEKA